MKTSKEIKLASLSFLKAFKDSKVNDLGGVFIPFSTLELYKRQHLLIIGMTLFGIISFYMLYNALFIDAIYYWHIDLPVLLGFIWISIYFFIFSRISYNFFSNNKILKKILANPEQNPYGVLITEDYYFENTLGIFHIIPRENILSINYEERRKDKIYLELVIDIENEIEIQGITYKKEEFDIKEWVNR